MIKNSLRTQIKGGLLPNRGGRCQNFVKGEGEGGRVKGYKQIPFEATNSTPLFINHKNLSKFENLKI